MAEETAEVIEETAEAEAVEQTAETPAEGAAEQVAEGEQTEETPQATETEDESRELWAKTVPELAGHYDELTPEARGTFLLKRLAAQSAGEPPTEALPEREASTGTGQQPRTPPVAEVPRFDVNEARALLSEHYEPEGADALLKVLAPAFGHLYGLANLVNDSLSDAETDRKAIRNQMSLPGRLAEAVQRVPGATDADVSRAVAILAKGDATNEEAAIRLAKSYRMDALASATPKKPSEIARRKADALAASAQSRAGEKLGQAVGKMPLTTKDYAEMLKRDAQ